MANDKIDGNFVRVKKCNAIHLRSGIETAGCVCSVVGQICKIGQYEGITYKVEGLNKFLREEEFIVLQEKEIGQVSYDQIYIMGNGEYFTKINNQYHKRMRFENKKWIEAGAPLAFDPKEVVQLVDWK